MIAMVCLDDRDGMLFHGRRQSRDRRVTERICQIADGGRLWIHPFSEKLFAKNPPGNLRVEEEFLTYAGEGEYCFVEDRGLEAAYEALEKVIVFRWNRKYPGDLFFDLDLGQWQKVSETSFAGTSHEEITEETYIRF